MTEKTAVCAIIFKDGNEEGPILAVSRRNQPSNMNLPGGKVDPGESLEEACIREIKEETGLDISNLRIIFQRPCEGKETYEAYCFTADYVGEPKSCEEGISVRWISWEELLAETNSFAKYNRTLYETAFDEDIKSW